MRRAIVLASCAVLACASLAASAPLGTPLVSSAASAAPSSFALTPPAPAPSLAWSAPALATSSPRDYLAQRTIEREWGPSDDSTYVTVDVPGLKSEALATSLSAILPGAGHLYCDEGSGWLYLGVEAAAWGGFLWYRHDAHRLNGDAVRVAGPPDQATSGWSFERWAGATAGDPSGLAALYAADPHAFYNAIATNPAYQAGWSAADIHGEVAGLLSEADGRLRRSRVFATGLWFNHLIAAIDALRTARFHNMPLRRNLAMRVQSRGVLSAPAVAMSLEVRF